MYENKILFRNKNAFQWDAYRPLVDRILACTAQRGVSALGRGVCPGGVYLPRGVSARRCLPRGVVPAQGGGCTC